MSSVRDQRWRDLLADVHEPPAFEPTYRADTDQNGVWFVWRRLTSNGWVTHQRCHTREQAEALAGDLNHASHAERAG